METVVGYKTKDGKVFQTEKEAIIYEADINKKTRNSPCLQHQEVIQCI